MATKPYAIGISVKLGSGKNYLAEQLAKIYASLGYTSFETSYGAILKKEATEIMRALNSGEPSFSFGSQFNIPLYQLLILRSFVDNDPRFLSNTLTGFDRSEGVRRFLQYLGTEIRRQQNPNYWVNKINESLNPEYDIVFITDVRFPNEADKVYELGGYLIRLEVSDEIILSRVNGRDGLGYSSEALSHASEKALDAYLKFDLILGASYDVKKIVTNSIGTPANGFTAPTDTPTEGLSNKTIQHAHKEIFAA
jgi:hypothetical protein